MKFEKISCTTHPPKMERWNQGHWKGQGNNWQCLLNCSLGSISCLKSIFEVDAILINWINHKIMNEVEATGNVKAWTLTVQFQSHQHYLCMILIKMCFEWYIALWNWTRGKHFVCLDLLIPSDNCMYIS